MSVQKTNILPDIFESISHFCEALSIAIIVVSYIINKLNTEWFPGGFIGAGTW